MLCSSPPKQEGLHLSDIGHVLESDGIGRIRLDENSKEGLEVLPLFAFSCRLTPVFHFKAAVAVVVKFVPTQRLIPCVHLRFLFLSFSYNVLWRRLLLCCQLSNFLENIPWLNGATMPGRGTVNDRQLAKEAGPFATVE